MTSEKIQKPVKNRAGGDGNIQTHAGAIEIEVVNPYAGEIADFVAAIEEGQRKLELLCEICP